MSFAFRRKFVVTESQTSICCDVSYNPLDMVYSNFLGYMGCTEKLDKGVFMRLRA